MLIKVILGGFKENILDQSPNIESTQFDIVSLTELFKEGDVYVAGSDNKTFDFISGKIPFQI